MPTKDPLQSCNSSPPCRSHWAAKDNTALVLQGETELKDNAKLQPTAVGLQVLWVNPKDFTGEVNGSSALQL